MKILVTGASGMLGRAVMNIQTDEGRDVTTGLSFSRNAPGCTAIDLRDDAVVLRLLARESPDVIIHTAAIRKPDDFAADESRARALNVHATETLARWTASRPGAFLAFVSSDYVFDGSHPPYRPSDPVSPINAYGRSKTDAEDAIRSIVPDRAAILRVPVLYGDADTLKESSILDPVLQVLALRDSPHPVPFDDWAVRYPTHVRDIATILVGIVHARLAGIWHWSAGTAVTKYDTAAFAAGLLGVPADLLLRSGAPCNGTATRPKDCHLLRDDLVRAGISTTDTALFDTIRTILADRGLH